jgi:hypothetical protein
MCDLISIIPTGRQFRVEFLHRKLSNSDIYFVENRGDHGANIDAIFGVAGNSRELYSH